MSEILDQPGAFLEALTAKDGFSLVNDTNGITSTSSGEVGQSTQFPSVQKLMPWLLTTTRALKSAARCAEDLMIRLINKVVNRVLRPLQEV